MQARTGAMQWRDSLKLIAVHPRVINKYKDRPARVAWVDQGNEEYTDESIEQGKKFHLYLCTRCDRCSATIAARVARGKNQVYAVLNPQSWLTCVTS